MKSLPPRASITMLALWPNPLSSDYKPMDYPIVYFRKCFLLVTILWCGFILNAVAFAQSGSIHFTHLSHDDGLSNNTVFSMVQDHQGFMWFGTPDGLNKYDGFDFKVFQNDPSIPHSLASSNAGNLFIDREGIIWIGTWGSGLIRLDPRTEISENYLHDPKDPKSLSDNRVQSLFQDSSGSYWFGTYKGGLNRFDPKKRQFKSYQHDPNNSKSLSHNRVWAILEGEDNTLWVATSEGLNQFDPQTESFTRFFYDSANPKSLSHNRTRTLHKTRHGVLWVGTEQGLNRFNPKTENFQRYFDDPEQSIGRFGKSIRSIHEDHKGLLWVGSRHGLVRFDRHMKTFDSFVHIPEDPQSLSENNVRSIFEDASGTMWIGMGNQGLNKFDNKAKKFNLVNLDHLSSKNVLSLLEDRRGALWVGTRGDGVSVLESKNARLSHFRHELGKEESLIDNEVWALEEQKNGTIWIGTRNGLDQWNPESQQFTHHQHDPNRKGTLSNDEIRVVFEDQQGDIWVGTYKGGLNRWDSEKQEFIHYSYDPQDPNSLSHREVWTIMEDRQGGLWVGTGDGLNRYDREEDHFTRYQHSSQTSNSLLGAIIYTVHEDEAGILWIGTDEGLNRWNRKRNEFKHFTKKDGLLNQSIKGIQQDNRNFLWLSTNQGLSRFNPNTHIFRNYDVDDGLQSREFNAGVALQTESGEILFGGIKGLNRFIPEQVKDNPYLPPVVLTDFKKFAKSVKRSENKTFSEGLELSYEDRFFSFEFAALDYSAPDRNQYAYKLDGFDRDWIQIGNKHEAHYTNLDSGNYIFRVKASNNDGIWNENGLALALSITPPPWKTWWAYLLYALSFFGALFGYVRYKNNVHKREMAIQTKELERESQEAERLEKLNVAYARFVPDEFLKFLKKNSIVDVELGNHVEMDMSILFADIRSFTTLSETMSPTENFKFLNSYLKFMEPNIQNHHGFIDKYVGDQIMALFHTSVDDAVEAAIAMRQSLVSYNRHRKGSGYQPVEIGVGIHTGSLMLGIIGGQQHMEGTVISDAVNVASRFEGMTKMYGAGVLISDATLQQLEEPSNYHHRELDQVRVKGKKEPVKVFEIFNADPPEMQNLKTLSGDYILQGLAFRRMQDWDSATLAFESALAIFPEDKAAQFHLRHIQQLRNLDLPTDWDGTLDLAQK